VQVSEAKVEAESASAAFKLAGEATEAAVAAEAAACTDAATKYEVAVNAKEQLAKMNTQSQEQAKEVRFRLVHTRF
jgi:hypothetical protein